MLLSLVSNQTANLPLVEIEEKEGDGVTKSWESLWTTYIEAHRTQVSYSLENVEKYCKKLKKIIGDDESREDGRWVLSSLFQWSPNQANVNTMHVRLSGKLMERLHQLCYGGKVSYKLAANLQHNYSRWCTTIKLNTADMEIFSPSTMLVKSQEQENTSLFGCSIQETFCEDIQASISTSPCNVTSESTFSATVSIIVTIGEEYLNHHELDIDKMSACKNIFDQRIHSDVSVVAADGSSFPCHKCFLATHSSVLKVMLQQENFKESKSNQIKMDDVSKECVMALLEFMYSWEITKALKSPELAVKLFQVAHKYDVKPLEKKLANMLLQRDNKWFEAEAALELFCFARKIETSSAELKAKAVQALKANREELLKSDEFKNLFRDDWETAMELCSMSI